MPTKDIYAMTDLAIAKEIGQRIEQLRLEANISQDFIAKELNITKKPIAMLNMGKQNLN